MKYEIRDLKDVRKRNVRRTLVGLTLLAVVLIASIVFDYPPATITEAMEEDPTTVSEYQQPTEQEKLIPKDQLVSPYLLNSVVNISLRDYVPTQTMQNISSKNISEFSGTVTVSPTSIPEGVNEVTVSPTPSVEPTKEVTVTPTPEVKDTEKKSPDTKKESETEVDTVDAPKENKQSKHTPDDRKTVLEFSKDSDVNNYSNLTIEEIEFLIEDYPELHGIADDVFYVENHNGINALFVLAVASNESGFGESSLAQRKNNLFGLGAYDESPGYSAITFDSTGECVRYFGKLIENSYVGQGRTTPNEIADKYCTSTEWAGDVTSLMKMYAKKLKEL